MALNPNSSLALERPVPGEHRALRRLGRRRFAIAVTAMAAIAATIGGNIVGARPARAEEVTLQTNCATFKPNVIGASGQCEIQKAKLAHQREQTVDKLVACLKELTAFKERDKKGFDNLGPVTKENACQRAAQIPRRSVGQPLPSG